MRTILIRANIIGLLATAFIAITLLLEPLAVSAQSSEISSGSTVQATAKLNVRSAPLVKTGNILCAQSIGSLGTVIGGPTSASGHLWWNIDFNSGCSGWSVQNYLKVVASSNDASQSTVTSPSTLAAPLAQVTAVAAATSTAPNASQECTGSTDAYDVTHEPVVGNLPAGVTWMTNYATQPVSGGWYERQVIDNCHFQADPTWPTWHGLTSARVEVDPGNDPLALGENSERAEQLLEQTQSGSLVQETSSSGTEYYATSYYFPTTWAGTQYGWSTMEAAQPGVDCSTGDGNQCNSWSIVMQFHLSGSNPWGFLYAAKTSPTGPELYSLDLGKTIPFSDGGAINLGGWTDFVFQMNWGNNTVSVWRRDQGSTNFTQVVNNAAFSAPSQAVYLKQGLYRGGDVSGRSDIFWIGPTAVGTTFSAVEQAAFNTNVGNGSGGGTTTPVPTASLSASPTSITTGQSSTLTWSSTNATSCTGMGFTASGTSGSVSVSPTATTNYSLTCSGAGGTSSAQAATVTVSAATSSKFTMGEQVTPTATVNVRSTAAGTSVGTQPAGAVATVIGGPTVAALSGTTYTWWDLNFATGVDGWVADTNLQAAPATPAPTASLSASPTSITSGQSSTLTWSSTNATSCTGTGFTASGTSGSVSVSPTTNTTYSLTCTGAGGTSSAQSATVTVSGTTAQKPTASLSASPTSITSGQSSTLTWSSTNATSCTGSGFTASGTSGSVTVSPTATTNYSLTCSGTGGTSSAATAMVSVSSGSTGGGSTGFLDSYSSLGATWGFSSHKLSSGYTGNWGTVTRQSDGTAMPIAFDSSGKANTATFNSFCAGTNCYLSTLNDQVAGDNATQSTMSKMPRVIIDTNGNLAVCPQPTSSMTTPYSATVNTPKVHLFAVAQLNYADNRPYQTTLPPFVVTGTVTQGSNTITNMSSQTGISTANISNIGPVPGVIDSSGFIPPGTSLSALPSGSTASLSFSPGDISASGTKVGDTLTFNNAVLPGAWIVNGPSSSTYYSSAYWGAGIGGDGSIDSWTAPRNGNLGYMSTYQNIIDQGMRGAWAVYDFDTYTWNLSYDGISLGNAGESSGLITYPTNTGMTLFSDTNGAENTSNTCFETMVLFPNTESSRVAMAQNLMSQDNISAPSAPTTSDGFTMTGEYLPSYGISAAGLGSESFTDAHGMTWYPQSGGYTWPSLAYANNITNGATMYRFIDEPGDSDTNITGAERTEIAEGNAVVTPGSSFSFFYQFEFEQLPVQNGDWCAIGQIHYNDALSGANAPDLVALSCKGGVLQFGTNHTSGGNAVDVNVGSAYTLTPGETYAVVGTGYWSANHTSDTLQIWFGQNGTTLNQVANIGPSAIWDNDTGAYLKAGIYRGYPWSNAGTAILRVMNPQMTTTANTFSSYITAQPPLPSHSGTTSPAPTATLSASPTSITAGQSSTLTWSSTNATSCTGTNFTASGTSGSVSVSPTATTNYSLSCSGAGGTSSAQTATVTVTAVTAQKPTASLSASPTSITAGQSSTLTWSSTNATSCTGTGFTASGTSGSVSVSPTATTNYSLTCSGAGGTSSAATAMVTVTPASTQPGKFTIGEQVATIGAANVRATAAGTLLGSQPAGAVATVTAGPVAAALNGTTYNWWDLNFNSGVDGWIADNNLQASTVSTPAPTASLSASPTSITAGQSSTLTWSSTNATSCTGTNFNASGTSGSVSVSLHQVQTYSYSLTCTGPGGTSPVQTVTIMVTAPAQPATASLSASPTSITAGQSSTLTWSSTNATSCTGTNFTASGTSGSISVSPTTTTTYSLTCTGSGGTSAAATATVTVTPASDTTPPTAPGNFRATAVSSSQVSLSWNRSSDNVGVAGYKVYRSTAGGSPSQIGTSTATTYSDRGLSASTQYFYYVVAFDAAGNVSATSATASATTQAVAGSGGTTATLAIDGHGDAGDGGSASVGVNLTTTQPNDVIVLQVANENGSKKAATTVSSVSDASGLTWHLLAATSSPDMTGWNGPVGTDMEVWWAIAPKVLTADKILPTFSGSTDCISYVAYGVSGANTTNPWDTSTSLPKIAVNTSTNGLVPSVSQVSTNAANTLLFGFMGTSEDGSDNNNATYTAGSGFTMIDQNVNPSCGLASAEAAEYEQLSSPQSNGTVALGASVKGGWFMLAHAIKAADLSSAPQANQVAGVASANSSTLMILQVQVQELLAALAALGR